MFTYAQTPAHALSLSFSLSLSLSPLSLSHTHTSSLSDTLRPTQRRSFQMPDVAVPQIGVGVFLCMIVVSRWSWRVSV